MFRFVRGKEDFMDFFNPIDILDQTRDDACRKTPAYNLNAWRKAGGKDGQEPYF